MILYRLWLAIAGGRSTSINIFVWQYLLGISRGLIMQIGCKIILLSPWTPAFVLRTARGSSVVEWPKSLLFFYFFALNRTWQVQTATVTWNNTLYNAYVNIQRLRVLAYAFGKSENYPSRIFEIRYQSMSLNLPADDSRCLSIRGGSNGISCLLPETKTFTQG